MPEIFYDTHAHLDYPDFASELEQVVQRAANAGIARIISIGTDLESSRRAIQLAEQFSSVFAVVGWHPSYALEAPADLRPALRDLAKHPRVVALGETGLDYHRLPSLSLKSKVESLKSGGRPQSTVHSPQSTVHSPEPEDAEALRRADEKYKAKPAELLR